MPDTCICHADHPSTQCPVHPTCQGQHTDRLTTRTYMLPFDPTCVMHAASTVDLHGGIIQALTQHLIQTHVPYGTPAVDYMLVVTGRPELHASLAGDYAQWVTP